MNSLEQHADGETDVIVYRRKLDTADRLQKMLDLTVERKKQKTLL